MVAINDYVLRCGNCADLLSDYQGQANLILTSPPYDGLRRYGGYNFDFDRVADACAAALAPGGVIVWIVEDATLDGTETGTSFRHALGFLDRGLNLHDTMIMQKALPRSIKGERRYRAGFSYMFVLSQGSPTTFNPIIDHPNNYAGTRKRPDAHFRRPDGERTPPSTEQTLMIKPFSMRSNIWRYSMGVPHSAPDFPDAHKHPAIFPLKMAQDHIRTWTEPDDLVIDPMMGSGTTIRAAVNLGRRAIGMDNNPEYLDLTRRRMAQLVLV